MTEVSTHSVEGKGAVPSAVATAAAVAKRLEPSTLKTSSIPIDTSSVSTSIGIAEGPPTMMAWRAWEHPPERRSWIAALVAEESARAPDLAEDVTKIGA